MSEAEPAITVASQVSIPTDTSPKRRATSPALHASKRQRLSPPPTDRRASPPHAGPPSRRALSPTSKNRSKRMFGNLLTTISKFQSELDSPRARAGNRKRRELEEKGRERAKLQEEPEVKIVVNGEKWRQWERDSLQTSHAALRNSAKFLITKAKPYILYLPYELRPKDERQLEQRTRDVERQIEREEAALRERHGKEEIEEREQKARADAGDVDMKDDREQGEGDGRMNSTNHDDDAR